LTDVERPKGPPVAKSRIVDAVADAVVRAEIAVVRSGRKAVAAVNRRVKAGTRKKTAVRKAVSKAKRVVRKVAKKAAKRVRPR
jgi:hypothetical protein